MTRIRMRGMKRNRDGAAAATIARPIATTGEVFADGSTIELIGDDQHGNPRLMLWDGTNETVGSVVERCGRLYEPASIDSSILREMTLPTRCCPHGTTRELLAEICGMLANVVGLNEKPASGGYTETAKPIGIRGLTNFVFPFSVFPERDKMPV